MNHIICLYPFVEHSLHENIGSTCTLQFVLYSSYYKVIAHKKVQVGKDQEKAQSERDSHSKNRGGEKLK